MRKRIYRHEKSGFFSDSQAALKRLKSREVRAGQYYTNQARTGIEKLRQKND